jgi:hypothetical protein
LTASDRLSHPTVSLRLSNKQAGLFIDSTRAGIRATYLGIIRSLSLLMKEPRSLAVSILQTIISEMECRAVGAKLAFVSMDYR